MQERDLEVLLNEQGHLQSALCTLGFLCAYDRYADTVICLFMFMEVHVRRGAQTCKGRGINALLTNANSV